MDRKEVAAQQPDLSTPIALSGVAVDKIDTLNEGEHKGLLRFGGQKQ